MPNSHIADYMFYNYSICVQLAFFFLILIMACLLPQGRGKSWLVFGLFLVLLVPPAWSVLLLVIYAQPDVPEYLIYYLLLIPYAAYFVGFFCIALFVYKVGRFTVADKRIHINPITKHFPESKPQDLLFRRITAYIIDYVLISLFSVFIAVFSLTCGFRQEPFLPLVIVVDLLLTIVLFCFKDCMNGLSFGKFWSGIRVVDRFKGRPIGLWQSFQRNCNMLIPFFPIIELIIAASRQSKLRMGDDIGRTTVVLESDFRREASINNEPTVEEP